MLHGNRAHEPPAVGGLTSPALAATLELGREVASVQHDSHKLLSVSRCGELHHTPVSYIGVDDRRSFTVADIAHMSVKRLRAMIESAGMPYADIVEKRELRARAREAHAKKINMAAGVLPRIGRSWGSMALRMYVSSIAYDAREVVSDGYDNCVCVTAMERPEE